METYLGQGTPLPPSFPYKGQWVAPPLVFLYEDDRHLIGGAAQRFNVFVPLASGDLATGFSAEQLAGAFVVTTERILESNADGSLLLLGTTDAKPAHGGISAKGYVFGLAGEKRCLVVEFDDCERGGKG
ncbi:MAG: hypothetical protein ABSC25_12905 [Roseiarcus sp.]|jgi:hypothetical protein